MLNGLFHSTQEPAGRRTIFELSTNLHYGVGGWHEDFTTCTSYFDVAHGRCQVKNLYINFFWIFFFLSHVLSSPPVCRLGSYTHFRCCGLCRNSKASKPPVSMSSPCLPCITRFSGACFESHPPRRNQPPDCQIECRFPPSKPNHSKSHSGTRSPPSCHPPSRITTAHNSKF